MVFLMLYCYRYFKNSYSRDNAILQEKFLNCYGILLNVVSSANVYFYFLKTISTIWECTIQMENSECWRSTSENRRESSLGIQPHAAIWLILWENSCWCSWGLCEVCNSAWCSACSGESLSCLELEKLWREGRETGKDYREGSKDLL